MMPIVLITGAGIGIGRASAKAFADAGYRVILTDVLDDEGRQAAEEISAAGGQAEFHRLDVRDTAGANAIVAAVEAAHGPIDVVLANAGIAHKVPLADLTDEKWEQTLDIDLGGVMRVVRAAAPAMRKRGQGCVIALSSIMGVAYGWDEHVHYSAAKSGVVGLVRGWRSNWRRTASGSTASLPATSARPRPCPRSTRWGRPDWKPPPASSRSAASGSRRKSPMSPYSSPPKRPVISPDKSSSSMAACSSDATDPAALPPSTGKGVP